MAIGTGEEPTSAPAAENLPPGEVRYKAVTTRFGTWKRYLHPSGAVSAEFTSRRTLFGLPLFNDTAGRSPETGSRKVARGVLAVGRVAMGIIPVGRSRPAMLPLANSRPADMSSRRPVPASTCGRPRPRTLKRSGSSGS